MELARQVDETVADDVLELRALGGGLADLLRLSETRMNVALFTRHVQIAHEHEGRAATLRFCRERAERVQETDLRWKIFAAVRHVNGRERDVADGRGHDARLVIELG